MTTTVPRPGPPRVGGPSLVRRLGLVYGYPILDPATGLVRTDYVGQTIQTLSARDRQHRGKAPNRDGSVKEQPWSDLIVGQPFVIESGMWTPAELDGREQHHIAALRPRYNIVGNLGNPDRIPPWEAQAQRAARDAARGVVTPSCIVQNRPLVSRPVRRRPATSRRTLWTRLARTLPFRVCVSCLLLALAVAVALAWGSHAAGDQLPAEWACGVGALAATFVHVKWWKKIRRLLRRR